MYGLLVGIALCYILYIPQKLVKATQAFDNIFRGFEDMFVVTAIVISAFVLQNCNDELGLAPYVVNSVVDIINGATLPVIAFVIMLISGIRNRKLLGNGSSMLPYHASVGRGSRC